MERPLLLIDIDGVISLFGFDMTQRPEGQFEFVDGIAHFLSATAGEHLRELSRCFELVWCSGWEEKANEYLPRALGLPEPLAHLTFDGASGPPHAHWKLAAIDSYTAAERPLAWIDDAHDERCRHWAAQRPGPTLLISTDPAIGLTDEQVDQLLRWAQELAISE